MDTKKIIDKLLGAYRKLLLIPQSCRYCAAGNIIEGRRWYDYLIGTGGPFKIDGLKEIENSGLSIEEVRPIERTFEKATAIDGSEYSSSDITIDMIIYDQLRGLKAVIEKIAKLRNLSEEETKRYLDEADKISGEIKSNFSKDYWDPYIKP